MRGRVERREGGEVAQTLGPGVEKGRNVRSGIPPQVLVMLCGVCVRLCVSGVDPGVSVNLVE